jgi:hypothetical protein
MKLSNLRGLLLLLVSVLMSSCVVYGSKFVPIQGVAGEAIVYLYRDTGLIGHGLDLKISANRETIAELAVGTYRALTMKPGEYRFTAEAIKTGAVVLSGIEDRGIDGNTLLIVSLEQGGDYYLKLAEGLGSLLIDEVDAQQGRADLQRLRPAD